MLIHDDFNIYNSGKDVQKYWCTFEGIDGTGKTTLLSHVVLGLEDSLPNNVAVHVMPEFSDSAIGELIRAIITQNRFISLGYKHPTAFAESLLLACDQFLRVESVVDNCDVQVIIGDRGPDSRVAFQSVIIAKEYPHLSRDDAFKWVSSLFAPLPSPDRTFLLRASEETIVSRANRWPKNVKEPPLDDPEQIRFLMTVNDLFEKMAENDHERFIVLDAENSIESLSKQALHIIIGDIEQFLFRN